MSVHNTTALEAVFPEPHSVSVCLGADLRKDRRSAESTWRGIEMGWNPWLKGRQRDQADPDPEAAPPDARGSESLEYTEGQRRHVEIAFRSLLTGAHETQARMREIAAMAGEDSARVQAVATEIDRLIAETRRATTTLELSLDTTKVPWHRELAAWAATSWSMILDCRPSTLRGYGPLDARLARAIEPVVDGIAARLLRIERMAEAAEDPDRHRG
jgi:hypothetical protein